MRRNLVLLSLVWSILCTSRVGAGAEPSFDAAMNAVLTEYLRIGDALSQGSIDGVQAAAGRIEQQATHLYPSQAGPDRATPLRDLPRQLFVSARRLARARDLVAMRGAYSELSVPLARWATLTRPRGVEVVWCAAASAPWLQRGAPGRNPYFGGKIACGPLDQDAEPTRTASELPRQGAPR